MGRNSRGGKNVASQRGYLHWPNSADEANFNLSLIELDGTWYYDGFSPSARAAPR